MLQVQQAPRAPAIARPSSRALFNLLLAGRFDSATTLLDSLSEEALSDCLRYVDRPDRHTCLHVAAVFNAPPDIISRLLAGGCDANARNDIDRTPTYLAARHNINLEAMSLLVNIGGGKLNGLVDRFSYTPLMGAAYRRASVNLVGRLVQLGAVLSTKDRSGKSAADWARTENSELLPGQVDNGAQIATYLDSFLPVVTLLEAVEVPRLRQVKRGCHLRLLPKDLLHLVRNALQAPPEK